VLHEDREGVFPLPEVRREIVGVVLVVLGPPPHRALAGVLTVDIQDVTRVRRDVEHRLPAVPRKPPAEADEPVSLSKLVVLVRPDPSSLPYHRRSAPCLSIDCRTSKSSSKGRQRSAGLYKALSEPTAPKRCPSRLTPQPSAESLDTPGPTGVEREV